MNVIMDFPTVNVSLASTKLNKDGDIFTPWQPELPVNFFRLVGGVRSRGCLTWKIIIVSNIVENISTILLPVIFTLLILLFYL